jgi:hypothetical protein
MERLALIALDEDDLKVLSAHLQDALVRMEDVAYLPKERRFAAVLKRFDWVAAAAAQDDPDSFYERREAALRFERVLGAQYRNLPLAQGGDAVTALLAVNFLPGEAPGGFIELIFAGDGAIRLQVECIEGELRDLGAVWRTRRKPKHPDSADTPQTTS